MHQRTIEIEAVDLAGLGTPTIEIAVTEAGVGGRPLLLLHGFTGTRGDFDDWYDELASLGVRRISIGGALARVAWGGVMRAAREIAEHGTFNSFAEGFPAAELNRIFTP